MDFLVVSLCGLDEKIVDVNFLQILWELALVSLDELLVSLWVVVDVFHLDLVDKSGYLQQLLLSLELLLGLLLWFSLFLSTV